MDPTANRQVSVHRSVPIIACALLLLSVLAGCAVLNEDNRRFLNVMDGAIQPGSTGGRIALAPAMVPVGTVALVADMFVVHPVCVIPDAADDVYELYWKPRDIDWLRKTLLFPVIVIATPPTFLFDWLGRSIFHFE